MCSSDLIVEVKFQGPEPALLADLCRTFRLAPQSLSKYRLGATALGVVSATPATLDTAAFSIGDPS